MSNTPVDVQTPWSRRWFRRAGLVIGSGLMLAAIIVVGGRSETVSDAISSIKELPAGRLSLYLITLVGSIVINLILSGFVFSLLMSRYGRVGLLEMQSVIAATTLVNFVPMRPGFFGRIAYHKSVNDISVIDSTKAALQAMVLSMAIAGSMAVATMVSQSLSIDLPILATTLLLALALAGLALPRQRIWLWAASLRLLEVLVNTARYFAAFALIGLPVEITTALALACVSVVATMVPFFSNGLGLREWAVGLVAPLLTGYSMDAGIAADLVNRAAEMTVVLVCGLIAIAHLASIRRKCDATR